MNITEACQKWVNMMDSVPRKLIEKAYEDEEINELTDSLSEEKLPMWGEVFVPERMDQEWIEENIETVADCGFRVYETDEIGVFLGVDGGGYSFIEEHFIPLYKARGLQWHQ